MDKNTALVLWFDQMGIEDVPLTGGKNASLGEMYQHLTKKGVRIPNGFATTAHAYRVFMEKAGIMDEIKKILSDLDTTNMQNLIERGAKVRQTIIEAQFPEELNQTISEAYSNLEKQYGENVDVAVRSSATAEDLPDASFAGQQETFLNIKGPSQLLDACKRCVASLFTNRAISYRVDKGFDHFDIALSIGVQKMVRSDLSASGVMFSIDTESGFKDAAFITASYGLGENIVQGAVNPDEYYVFKPTLKEGKRPIIEKKIGDKKIKMIYCEPGSKCTTKNVPVPEEESRKFVLTDDEVLELAKYCMIIEDHYSKKAGHFKPMDMEWAKDGVTDELFVVQARPETVQSQKDRNFFEQFHLKEKGKVLIEGRSVGDKIGSGKARIIKDVKDIHQFEKGEVLVTDMTDPDWEPIMKIASAIVTNRGGRTCFPAGTKILTNRGFMDINEIYEDYEDISVPSLNRETLKVEWKPVMAAMKRKADVIEIETSLTGRMKGNKLRLTPNHKMLTYENAQLQGKEIQQMLNEEQMLLCAQKIPSLNESTEKQKQLAYLLGAISTDGHIYTTRTHGEVQLIQKETPEKKEFIDHVNTCLVDSYNKEFKKTEKKISTGEIRGKPVVGNANAYRCYSKNIAYSLIEEQKTITQTLLKADIDVVYSFLAGVIDGDGSLAKNANRINIYCSKEYLLQAITVSCLRIGIVPQITNNRTIWNVQIAEKIDEILSWTKRVKGDTQRKRVGTRFFSAKQLLEGSNIIGKHAASISNNLLIDIEKIQEIKEKLSPEYAKRIEKITDSDTRMQRTSFNKNCGEQDVYNITVADNHNYIVFTDRYTPILVNNCHAAIISRELGIPCVVGTRDGTVKIPAGKDITVSCAQGDEGFVYEGKLKFEIEKHDIGKLAKPKTHIMMNLGNPEIAFPLSFLPNEGIGLAREEFIINSYIKIHPKALMNFKNLKDENVKKQIEELTYGYTDKTQFFVDKLAEGVAKIAAAFYPKKVIVRMSDFKSNEYASLIGGKEYEPTESNPMIGWRGASRYYSKEYKDAFGLECKAMKKVRDDMGLTNVRLMIPFCRTVEEGKKVLAVMEEYGLKQGENSLEVYAMCEIPSNVILAEEFLEIFDGFSIGSNDLTQLTLGVDRDSELVAHVYDERDEAVKTLVRNVVDIANKKGKYMGFCGQAPSDHPEFAQFLVECNIQSISLNPDSVIATTIKILETEKKMGR